MLQILRARATQDNPAFKKAPRKSGDDNVQWLQMVDRKSVRLILLGGTNQESYRMRIAQAHARDDMSPSHWSHVAIVASEDELGPDTEIHHIQIEPILGHSELIADNGVEKAPVSLYADHARWPNIAVIWPRVECKAVQKAIEEFRGQRPVVDAIELALLWLAFICGVGRTPNPLIDLTGIPSAVFAEHVLSSAGLELTPGLPNRAACPEAIWQAARWWYDFHGKASSSSTGLEGAYCVADDFGTRITRAQ